MGCTGVAYSPVQFFGSTSELENLITLEFNRSGNPWISITKLTQLFYEKYEVSPEEAAKAQDYSNNLRSLFTSSKRFSIYGTQVPQEFYVALLQTVLPDFYQSQAIPIESGQRSLISYEPILVPEIKSVNDLEIALIGIMKSLTANHPKKTVTIGELNKRFSDCYKQPIRTVIRSVCPDIKLIELLQTIPSLHVQKLDNSWQIALEIHSVE